MTRTDLIHTITHLAAVNHSGQWSRGYRLLTKSLRWLRRRGIYFPLDTPVPPRCRSLYRQLLETYHDKL